MSLPSEPNEFRYRSDARRGAFSLLGVAVVLFIASLAHASFLDTNDLPVGDNVAWGIGLLFLATLQGVSALLVLFDRRAGVVLGTIMAVLALLSHVGAISAYPVWSLVAIAINLWIIYVLAVHGPKRHG